MSDGRRSQGRLFHCIPISKSSRDKASGTLSFDMHNILHLPERSRVSSSASGPINIAAPSKQRRQLDLLHLTFLLQRNH